MTFWHWRSIGFFIPVQIAVKNSADDDVKSMRDIVAGRIATPYILSNYYRQILASAVCISDYINLMGLREISDTF